MGTTGTHPGAQGRAGTEAGVGMTRPKLLDLFCCAGGAGMGYHRAGFDVTGVDINPQPNYPFSFHQGDALDYLAAHGHEYDVVHASPPCQASCALIKGNQRATAGNHTNLIPQTREALTELTVPTVLENVQGSDLRRDLTLCGEMFGLGVIRHRYFELGRWSTCNPAHVPHRGRVAGYRHGQWFDGPYFAVYGNGGGKGSIAQWQQAMGIDWTTDRREIAEAIPPAYTQFIGNEILSKMAVAA